MLSADGDSLTLEDDWPESLVEAGTMVHVKTVVSGLTSETAPLRFDYYVHNVDVEVQSTTPPYLYYGLFDFVAPTDNLTVLSQGNDKSWVQSPGPTEADWNIGSEDHLANTILPNGDAHFWLTATRGPVVVSSGHTWEWTYNGNAHGSTLGEDPKPTVGITTSDYIPVNANNDNFKLEIDADTGQATNEGDRWLSVDQPYIPKVRDFTVTQKIGKKDPQLIPVVISVAGTDAKGVLEASVTSRKYGKARLFKEQDKDGGLFTQVDLPITDPATGNKLWSKTVYIEGTHESEDINDLSITASFAQLGAKTPATPKDVTVTPVIKSLTTDTAQVRLVGNDTLAGIQAVGGMDQDGKLIPGVRMTADVINASAAGSLDIGYG